MAFKHNKFWQPMDTIREKEYLEELYDTKKAPLVSWQIKKQSNEKFLE